MSRALKGLVLLLLLPMNAAQAQEEILVSLRRKMVDQQIESRGIKDDAVLHAMRSVPRHAFVAPKLRASAYEDRPLPIAAGQTISQPYIVALMTELAEIESGDRVLEIGTGSGYQAAILATITDEVYSIEIIEKLATSAREVLERMGFDVQVRVGDGYQGWPEAAPFKAILVTAAAPRVPQPLLDQLDEGGRLVIPVGEGNQELMVYEKRGEAIKEHKAIPVRFVPMVGAVQSGEQ